MTILNHILIAAGIALTLPLTVVAQIEAPPAINYLLLLGEPPKILIGDPCESGDFCVDDAACSPSTNTCGGSGADCETSNQCIYLCEADKCGDA